MNTHVVPRRVYYLVFATLLLLTFVTVDVAFYQLGLLATPVALAIATTKALLVVVYFMHLRAAAPLARIFAAAGILWLVILVGLTLSDFITRGWF